MAAPRQTAVRALPSLRLVEEAIHLLRTVPLSDLLLYYIGALPFALGLMYFWVDMSHSAFARGRCFAAALALAGLFVWMKTWQALFGLRMRERRAALPTTRWNPARLARMAGTQAVIQPFGFLLIPFSVLTTPLLVFFRAPAGRVMAFFQTLSAMDDGGPQRTAAVAGKAWRLSGLWQLQNHVTLWLISPWPVSFTLAATAAVSYAISEYLAPQVQDPEALSVLLVLALIALQHVLLFIGPFALVVAANIAITLFTIPALIKMLFGIESQFTLSGLHLMMNSTFFMTVFVLTYLALDPVVKTAYALRCFYGMACTTGDDLRADLAALRKRNGAIGILALVAGLGLAAPSYAAEPLEADALDTQLREVVQDPQYTWRAPRVEVDRGPTGEGGPLLRFAETVREQLLRFADWALETMRALLDWFVDLFWQERPVDHSQSGANWQDMRRILILLLLLAVASLLGLYGYRVLRARRNPIHAEAIATTAATVDLEDEGVRPDDLPVDEWLALSQRMLAAGEPRLALRALYLGALAHLARGRAISIARHKSNMEYVREAGQRFAHEPEMLAALKGNTRMIEAVWYGEHPVTRNLLQRFAANHETVQPGQFQAEDWLRLCPEEGDAS